MISKNFFRLGERTKRYISSALFFIFFLISGCLKIERNQTENSGVIIKSVFTDLSAKSCKNYIDKDDPNNTPYQICPGVSGYKLVLRHIGSGRQSIDIVTPSQEYFPLKFREFITRNMFHLDDKVEWRVLMSDGKKIPVALMICIHAHENHDEPEQVTRSYFALTKITPDKICVTHKVLLRSLAYKDVRNLADSARLKDCLDPQFSKQAKSNLPHSGMGTK